MKISKKQFKKYLANSQLADFNLIFLGMSGTGKSHWSHKLNQAFNLKHFDFDELIGNSIELKDLIKDFTGKNNTQKLAAYFQMPWSEGFNEREKQYMQIEEKLMQSLYPLGSVLDLTGSAIYYEKTLEKILKNNFTVTLDIDDNLVDEMFEIYIKDPKPVVWSGLYEIEKNETKEQALERGYRDLLNFRKEKYRKYGDIVIPYRVHKGLKTGEELVREIEDRL
jgi:shikimate kinase